MFQIILQLRESGVMCNGLWGNKYIAIASCNFEDHLPYEGGYK